MVSAEISKRLQEGWTLLNDHCPMPNCGTPLLQDHKKEIYCAKCQMYCISADKAKSLGTPNGNASASAAAGDGSVPSSSSTVPEQQQASVTGAEAKPSRAAAEAAMGEKLLQGWTMLAQECPTTGCCFPLMRDRSRNTTCVACGGNGVSATDTPHEEDVDGDGQFADPPAVAAPASTVSAPPPPAAPTMHSNDAAEEPAPVISEEEFAAVRKKRDALSASLGRYMLQGWSLLDRMCPREGCEPGTPLLKNRNTSTFYCAGCDTRMCEGEAGGLVVESTEASSSTAGLSLKRDSSGERNRNVSLMAKEGAVLSVPTKAEPMQVESEYELAEKARLRKQAAREQSSSGGTASATLAQRLLQGWAMLSTTCPEPDCHNPLMRDRSGKEQCVSCGSGGKATAASTPRQEAAAGAAAATAARVPVQAAGDFAGEMETEEDEENQALLDDGAGRMYAERRMEELLASSAGGAAGGPERAGKSDVEGDGDVVDRLRIQRQALDALYRALDLSQQRLRVCSSSLGSVDVDESVRQADLIAKLAVATRAVLEMPSGS